MKSTPKKRNVQRPMRECTLGTDVGDLYSTCLRWGLALGVTQVLAFGLGVTQIGGNTKLWRWVSKPMRGPNANGFASQWN